jgi:hypothetical protein
MSAQNNKLVSFKDLYAKRREQPAPAPESLPTPDSLPAPDSLTSPDSLSGDVSHLPETDAIRPDSLPAPDSPPAPDSLIHDLWAPFRERRGHFKQSHAYTDGLCGLLDVYEQAVFTQLYRLSHGYNKDTCKIGLPSLARRANCGRTSAAAAVGRLIQKGLIRKLEVEFGRDREQGSTYWVSSPDRLPGTDRLSGDVPIKLKPLKEKNKKGAHTRKDYSDCPDCRGTGMWYPGGFDKGVAKCGHDKLRAPAEGGG